MSNLVAITVKQQMLLAEAMSLTTGAGVTDRSLKAMDKVIVSMVFGNIAKEIRQSIVKLFLYYASTGNYNWGLVKR